MKVVHLCSTDVRGGASRGSFWLHRALGDMGVDSLMLVGRKYSTDERVVQIGGRLAPLQEWVRGSLDELPLRLYRKTDQSYWTVGWMPRKVARIVDKFEPDLVHIHWTGGGFLPIDALSGLAYPLVWTLRDMWAFTGGCHYTAGCTRFKWGCGRCPQLRSDHVQDLSRTIWQRKHAAWTNGLDLRLVPISNWLAKCVGRSPLFSNVPITVIPNGVDGQQFRPIPRPIARAQWNLDPDKRYILFGAIGAIQDERKGFAQLAEATRRLAADCWTTTTELIVFGEEIAADAVPPLGLRTRFVGRINDDERLAHLYAAADVMVVPSLEEAFGKTLIEAMACGVPVVAFNHGGPADIVVHGETGYLAQPFDPGDLAQGIAWCLKNRYRAETLSKKARLRVEENYDLNVVARHYRNLYQRILEGHS